MSAMKNLTIVKPLLVKGNRIRTILYGTLFLFLTGIQANIFAQQYDSITLDKCYNLAIEHSTISKQKSLQQQIADENVKTANTGWLPKVDLNGQASYQNDIIPVEQFGNAPLSKDQYKASLDLQQVIYDGGYICRQKQLYNSSLQVEQKKLDIDVQQLKDRINSLYLSVLLISENIRLVELLKKDITANIEELSTMLSNGVALKSNVDILEAERMKADQKLIELTSNKKTTLEMLSILIGKTIPEYTVFSNPAIEVNLNDTISNRPEYKLFDSQKVNLQNQSLLIGSKNMPKLYLFANNGYGRPGFNMLSNDFTYIGIAGIKLSISLTNWTSTRHECKVVTYQQSLVDVQKEDFARNNNMQIAQQVNEIDKYKQLIEKDKEIVAKRSGIKETESAKLANGVSTSNDYVTELNAENQAMLNLKLHEIQLMQSIISYNSLKGN
jgi:outer membrane protein TolC